MHLNRKFGGGFGGAKSARNKKCLYTAVSGNLEAFSLAAGEGFEPSQTESEPEPV